MRAALQDRHPPAHAPHLQHTLAWLTAQGSLTARLRRHGTVRVQVGRQGRQRLWPHETARIGHRHGHVREVILWVDDQPAVWARSVTSQRDARGPWRAIKGLANRPLAEVLFMDTTIRRTPLQCARWAAHGLPWSHRRRAWLHCGLASGHVVNQPDWARSSVFLRRGAPLLVTECLAPWLTALSP